MTSIKVHADGYGYVDLIKERSSSDTQWCILPNGWKLVRENIPVMVSESEAETIAFGSDREMMRLRGPKKRGRPCKNGQWQAKKTRVVQEHLEDEDCVILQDCLCCMTHFPEQEVAKCPHCVWRMCHQCRGRHYSDSSKRCPHCGK